MTRKIKTILHYLLPLLLVLIFAVITILVFRAIAHDENAVPDSSEQTSSSVATEPTDPTPDSTASTEYTEADLPADEVVQYEGSDPNTSDTITGNIISASVKNNAANIYVNLDQQLSLGTCTLTIEGFTTEAKVTQSGASTSTCQGFSVALSTLASYDISSGKHSFTIKINADGKSGTLQGEIEL